MYSSLPLASHKNTCMAGSTTAPNTNQWTPEEQSLFVKKDERCHQCAAAWGSPTLQSGGNNHKRKQSAVAQKGDGWLQNPYRLGVPNASERGAESEAAHKWAGWVHNPYRLGGPQRFRAGETIGSGNNQEWPKKGPGGYITPAAWGVPNASQWGTKSEVAHKWAGWLHNPYCLGVPNASEWGKQSEAETIGSGPKRSQGAT